MQVSPKIVSLIEVFVLFARSSRVPLSLANCHFQFQLITFRRVSHVPSQYSPFQSVIIGNANFYETDDNNVFLKKSASSLLFKQIHDSFLSTDHPRFLKKIVLIDHINPFLQN